MKPILLLLGLAALASAAPKGNKLGFRSLYVDPPTPVQNKPSPRIVGGEEAEPHSLPYQVFLESYSATRGWYCGGSLVSENYIITAAHCSTGAVQIHITLGAHRALTTEDTQVRLQATDVNVRIFEGWDSENLVNDLAVIKLPEPVTFNEYIQPVALPSLSDVGNDYTGASAIASGWGVVDGNSNQASPVLNQIEVKVISNLECGEVFGVLEPTKICTAPDEDKSVCSGDSGGPLVTDGVLIGVTAFVVKDCPPEYPSGFTRITEYLDWISNNTDVTIS